MTHPQTIAASTSPSPLERLEAASIDRCLNAIEADATRAASFADFLKSVRQRLSALGFDGIAFYRCDSNLVPELEWISDEQPNLATSVIASTLQTGKPELIDTRSAAAPNEICSVILTPLHSIHDVGVIAFGSKRLVTEQTFSSYFPLLAGLSELIGNVRLRFKQTDLTLQIAQHQKVVEFNNLVHRELELQKTAYTIANELRRLIDCGRVSLALRQGKRYRMVAVSGAEHIHRHSPSTSQLERLCHTIAAHGEPLWYPRESQELPPQIDAALDDYLDLAPANDLAVVPLTDPSVDQSSLPIGVLLFEDFKDKPQRFSATQIQPFLNPSRLALTHAADVSAIPAHQWWMRWSRQAWIERWGMRTVIAIAVLLGILGSLILIPADIRARATGELQPTTRREIFAPRDAVVTNVLVKNGDKVAADAILMELRSTELDLLQQQVDGELDTTRKKLAATQSERLQLRLGESDARMRERRLTAEEDQLTQQVRALEKRQSMLRSEYEKLTIRAPIAGQVLTWNAQERLATRPVRRGESLLMIADVESEWEVHARIPNRKVGRFLEAQAISKENSADVVLTSEPGRTLEGRIEHVASRIETDEAGVPYLLVKVDVPQASGLQFVAGNSAVVYFSCGRGSLGEAWGYEFIDAVRLWLPF